MRNVSVRTEFLVAEQEILDFAEIFWILVAIKYFKVRGNIGPSESHAKLWAM